MANISGKPNLFFVTSPRSPFKMREEIPVLVENFKGKKWSGNSALQMEFYKKLAKSDFFTGSVKGDLAFKARDRITRGPKSLGLVNLEPEISLTTAGESYVYGKRPHEAFTRQLLKFQFPSPYHVDIKNNFFIRPYLELFRLTRELNGLSKDEIAAFVIQLININKYDYVKKKILNFRNEVKNLDRKHTSYSRYFDQIFIQEIISTYAKQIKNGVYDIRESNEVTREKFLKTKKGNHKDYADASIRYLRETRLVSIKNSHSNRIYIPDEKIAEVDFLLEKTPREPVFINDKKIFKAYLYDHSIPELFSDNKDLLISSMLSLSPTSNLAELTNLSIDTLKDKKDQLTQEKLSEYISSQISQIKSYSDFHEIIGTFKDIVGKNVFDPSLIMEWNTWRAFVMLNDGEIIGNFRFDDTGFPLSNAPGNQADLECIYNEFDVIVEVTLSSGATQYNMEGEPVSRHLGLHKKTSRKESFCIFIAPTIHEATLAHFYGLHKVPISYYGGISKIIPINLSDFVGMLNFANDKPIKPTASHIKKFVETACDFASISENEHDWYGRIKSLSTSWV